MRLSVRLKKVEEKVNTTKFEPIDEAPPLKNYYIDTETVSLMPFDTEELDLFLSRDPFNEGEVAIAFPPLPFIRSTTNLTRFEILNDRGSRLRTSLEYPVTLVFVYNDSLGAETITDERPLYSGISPVIKTAVKEEEQVTADTSDVAEDPRGQDALAVFDAFLRDSVRVRRGSRLTSRQIWRVWAARWGADPDDEVVAGVAFTDVSRRFRTTFGATTAPNPARIDGSHQRYWSGFAI